MTDIVNKRLVISVKSNGITFGFSANTDLERDFDIMDAITESLKTKKQIDNVNLESLQKAIIDLYFSLQYITDPKKLLLPLPEDFSELNKGIEIVREQINKYLPVDKSLTKVFVQTDSLKNIMSNK